MILSTLRVNSESGIFSFIFKIIDIIANREGLY